MTEGERVENEYIKYFGEGITEHLFVLHVEPVPIPAELETKLKSVRSLKDLQRIHKEMDKSDVHNIYALVQKAHSFISG